MQAQDRNRAKMVRRFALRFCSLTGLRTRSSSIPLCTNFACGYHLAQIVIWLNTRSMTKPLQHPPIFSVAQLDDLGLPRTLARRGQFQRLAHGIYRDTTRDITEADALLAVQHQFPGSVVTGLSAMRLWGLPLPYRVDSWTEQMQLDCGFPSKRYCSPPPPHPLGSHAAARQ